MTLFEHNRKQDSKSKAPLAARMRPRSLEEFVGQEHLIGRDKVLRKSIDADQIPSMIMWGPPGSGKTTLANIIANMTGCHFSAVSAVTSGVAELRKVIQEAQERQGMYSKQTILFIDEIHRFNKAQQDVILPHVEDGSIILIGATTENPSFEVISPLLSRSRVFVLNPLTNIQLRLIIERAIKDKEHGLGNMKPNLTDEAINGLVLLSNGDVRIGLNALEMATTVTKPDDLGNRNIDLDMVEDAMQRRSLLYDKSGDQHYDTISAFIKSVRASDPDAAIYWMVRMLESGEDPLYIARRLIILAAEDIGMADPQGLSIAVAAQQAVHFIGLPEAAIPLAEATIYLATAPKSNTAYKALNEARQDVRNTRNNPVPMHLRNAVTSLMGELGYGKEYKYSHDYPGHFAAMQNLPESLKGRHYYQPSDQGYEQEVIKRLNKWWGNRKTEDTK